jgi:hypothetical protein
MGESEKKTVEIHYIKNSNFRVVHADGAWGGLTPHLDVFVTFYSERPPIPQIVTVEVTPEGKIGDEVSRQGKSGIVREAEIGVVLDEATAKSLVDWLNEKLSLVQQIREGKIKNDERTSDHPVTG